ncbi:hypothetical protein CVT26_007289 [Gymnopilus dilepis]|uniref:BTB domain-containing protein n=1 Tax=Gymnopilus dilepis TaxID=231916 RepID=A0A409VLX9_9AGAR|nr:hypothetical protein CVT26_007289 [Gymnopilus dilepis]
MLKTEDAMTTPKRKLVIDSEDEQEAESPRKRPQTYVHHFHRDGNVLLQIDSTRFKLHKSRLANMSPWFKALFDKRDGSEEVDFVDEAEIDQVLETVEELGDLDLFHIDFEDVDEAGFAELLKCVDNAISYLTTPPDFLTIVKIVETASFFRMDDYVTNLAYVAKNLFPDEPDKIGATIPPHAISALECSRQYDDFRNIYRCAFYQLARSSPEKVESLEADDLFVLLKVQRNLATTWESIVPVVEPNCNDAKCLNNRVPNTAIALRKKHLFDPIYGIRKLINQDWESKGFCSTKQKEVIAKLKAERSKIWTDFGTWIGHKVNDPAD